jgi:SecD/SecF fusion protein
VNDSVVVFDRIRELIRGRGSFVGLANTGCLQTVPRTVNTGLGAVFVLAALALFGRDSLVDFAVALLIGIGVGTYSSVFLATPLAIVLESRRGGLVHRMNLRARPRVKAARPGTGRTAATTTSRGS